jgi:GTP pyrophosphokinase
MAAKADGAIIPLSAPLQNAQTVEIVTANNARPHQNWLNIVKTAKARNKIRAWLEANEADKALPKKEKKAAKPAAPETKPAGEAKSAGETEKTETTILRTGTAFKIVAGNEKNMLVRYARCCNPVAGDEITGYVSRGRGIIIHKKKCPNLDAIPPERFVTVEWEGGALPLRRFAVEARETKGDSSLFAEIEGAVRKFRGHLVEGKLEESGSGIRGTFTMQLENAGDAAKILRHIRGIPAVQSIRGLG